MIETKPCPFCGAEHQGRSESSGYFVYCPTCHARGPVMSSMTAAAAAWNAVWEKTRDDPGELEAYRTRIRQAFVDSIRNSGDDEADDPASSG